MYLYYIYLKSLELYSNEYLLKKEMLHIILVYKSRITFSVIHLELNNL